jgi:RNA polymerase sigma-70 factor, ECF subfamily
MRAISDTDDDAMMISGLITGHRATVETFVRCNAGWMHSVARRYLTDEALAEDCVQESFASMFKSLHRFEQRSRLRSWLHRIVINTALMKLRSIRRRREDSIEMVMPTMDCDGARIQGDWSDEATPADVLDQAETAAIVVRAIDRLPENYRSVLRLLDIDGLDTCSAAIALKLSEGNVKVRLHRARIALKKLVEPALLH